MSMHAICRCFCFSLILAMAFESSWAGNKKESENFAVQVQFDNRYYQLSANTKEIRYTQDALTFSIPKLECSKKVQDKIIEKYLSYARSYKNEQTNAVDVQVQEEGGQKLSVSRGSPFGIWLRDLPKQITYLHLKAKVACRL